MKRSDGRILEQSKLTFPVHDGELGLYRHALTYMESTQAAAPDAGFSLTRSTLDEVIAKHATFPDAVASGKIKCTGDAMRLAELMSLIDEFPRMFEIVEPRRAGVS